MESEHVSCLNPLGTKIDAAVCLYLDQVPPSNAEQIEKLSAASAAAVETNAHGAHRQKMSVPAALAAAGGTKDRPSYLKGTRPPSFFSRGSAYSPSHANVAEYAVLSFLANCAKSSHNHFEIVAAASGEAELRYLLLVDNDRCFTANAVLTTAISERSNHGADLLAKAHAKGSAS